jgi:hypothetical protein
MIVNLERRIRKIEARRIEADPALKTVPDDELAQRLREVSDNPSDQALVLLAVRRLFPG